MGHDCPVPVAYKPISTQLQNITPPPPTLVPSAGSKVIYFNFAITKLVVIFSTAISHAERGTRDIKHIKRDLVPRPVPPPPWVDLGDWAETKVQLYQNVVMLHIILKGMTHAATW